jgi:outer membrane protein OmpA-like peptidoglycan-associated protein
MKDLLDFKNKKDRDDFFIALAVILLFFGLFFGVLNSPDITDEIQAAVPTILVSDSDDDGIPDDSDNCPNIVGDYSNKGCPADKDKDGVYDVDDKCPGIAGATTNLGCPLDIDKDGVADNKDKCPKIAGVSSNHGCPPDRDKDGIYDKNDKCPDLAGTKENKGCPKIKLNKEEVSLLNTAMRNVEFQTGSANLKPASTAILDKIVKLMSKYPKYKLNIDGSPDNVGDAQNNMQLSRDRARACYDYLLSLGINKSRMSFKGFGQQKPIARNETPEGRNQNRRVEFNLHY